MKYRQQYDSSDCGAACLAMIASYFGTSLNIAEIRHFAGTDSEGTNFKGMLDAAKHYGLKARAVEGEKEAITKKLLVPFIAHIKLAEDKESGNHYVVVRKIFKNKILIYDPDKGKGKQFVSYSQFFDHWTGYAIFLEPDVNFQKSNRQNLLLKFLPVFLPHKKLLAFSFICSVRKTKQSALRMTKSLIRFPIPLPPIAMKSGRSVRIQQLFTPRSFAARQAPQEAETTSPS